MRKVLLLFTEISDKGGIEVFSKYFLSSILDYEKETKFDSILVNNKEPPKIEKNCNEINYFCCDSQYKLIKKLKFVFFFLKSLIFEKPEYIISNHISLLRLYSYLHPLFKIKYGFVGYGIDVWNLDKTDKKIIKDAKVIAPFSNYTANKIKKQIKSEYSSILFPPLVEENKFFIKPKNKELIKKYNLKKSNIILTVSRLFSTEKYKGYDHIITALPNIIKKIPDVKYLIIGKGNDLPRIKKMVEELNLESYVIFCGFVPNNLLIEYYNICDIFAMPSKGEGFGMVFLEALACGKPVIAGNRDGSCDALLNGELGVLIDPENLQDLEETIINVLNKKIPKKLLDKKYLRKKVIEIYGINKFKERTKKFIEMVKK